MKIKTSRYSDIVKEQARLKVKPLLSGSSYSGNAPAPFIGRFGYPHINIGIMAPPHLDQDTWKYDAPGYWAAENMQIPQIVEYRSGLINSRFKGHVQQPHRYLEVAQEVGMASKPVEIEVKLKNMPKWVISSDAYAAPLGPHATLQKVEITSNPRVKRKVDKVVDDTDLKATEAVNYLYKHGFDENFLSQLLSVGTVGVKEQRKLVPTRWAITATDDMIGKQLLEKVRDFPMGDYAVYFGGYLGNYYLILCFPESWSYELFETYLPEIKGDQVPVSTDYEGFFGRKNYAENCAGGYYTVRLAISEKLMELRRQASVLALRFITDEYTLPLGVWVTREATRKAFQKRPTTFSSKELMMTYAKHLVKYKFGFDLELLLKRSWLLKETGKQQRLDKFF